MKKKVLCKKSGNEVLIIDFRNKIAESVINNEKKTYTIIEIVQKPFSLDIEQIILAAA